MHTFWKAALLIIKKRSQKDFRIELAHLYLKLFCARGTPGRKSLSPPQPKHSTGGHWPTRLDIRRRCARCREKLGIEVRSWYCCPTCDVGLCPECFEQYHSCFDIVKSA